MLKYRIEITYGNSPRANTEYKDKKEKMSLKKAMERAYALVAEYEAAWEEGRPYAILKRANGGEEIAVFGWCGEEYSPSTGRRRYPDGRLWAWKRMNHHSSEISEILESKLPDIQYMINGPSYIPRQSSGISEIQGMSSEDRINHYKWVAKMSDK